VREDDAVTVSFCGKRHGEGLTESMEGVEKGLSKKGENTREQWEKEEKGDLGGEV